MKHSNEGGHTTGKYLLIWSLNNDLVPTDPKERASGWGMLMKMVKQEDQASHSQGLGVYFPAKTWGIVLLKGTIWMS